MEFRETLLAAQRNQQQKSSESYYYKARFDPPKKEQKVKDKLSANIQKFLAKKEEEEKQKQLEAQRKREELIAMRDPKALRKIQKTLKVIKSANKSVLEDAVDRNDTAVTRDGPEQPDQDDYGYVSQEATALYEKMMEKYSKIPDEPKFSTKMHSVSKDLNGTRERVKNALQHEDEPVPHKRRRRGDNDKELSPPPKYEPERRKDEKSEKPKIRKPAPPPMDFNQLLKLAEKKKSEPIDVVAKKLQAEPEPDRLMTKKQKKDYEDEMARRQRRQERIDAEKGLSRKAPRDEKPVEREKKLDSSGIGRIPKLGDKNSANQRSENSKLPEREKDRGPSEKEKAERLQREKERAKLEKHKAEREKERLDRERLEKLKAEREKIDRDIERLNRDRDRLEKTKSKLEAKSSTEKLSKPVNSSVDRPKLNAREQPLKQEVKKSIDLKSQNTYRIDKNQTEKKISIPSKSGDTRQSNGYSAQGKPAPKMNKELPQRIDRDKLLQAKQKMLSNVPSKSNGHVRPEGAKRLQETGREMPAKRPEDKKAVPNPKSSAGPSKPSVGNSFDFDKHVNSIGKNGGRQFPPGDVRRKPRPDDLKRKKRRAVDSESDYDSEMDDFIDDGDENIDYSTHIKEIFGYDKSKYRYMDDDDDPMMESSFARQQREEYISKKIGIMEDLEDMRMEAMEKKKTKKRRISDD
ncbi:PREDICTED: protein SPT2 homolog [Papilio polytes]|uniref:protein SPT2 homolog n=1 Tax=Papilio polytes TaxID=76194 RepID=UPI000675BE19|nr:PREDICTED: protein SPT2 homolog [Papilio polytes]